MGESSWLAGGQGTERTMTVRVIHGQHKPPYTTTRGRRQTVKGDQGQHWKPNMEVRRD